MSWTHMNNEKKYLCGQCGDLVDKVVYNTENDIDECTDCETHFSEKHPKSTENKDSSPPRDTHNA